MNFAIQCLEESVIGSGGYQSEFTPYSKNIHPVAILETFSGLMAHKLISREYYADKGHKVLGKMIKGTNSFEIDPNAEIDQYDESYRVTATEIITVENKTIPCDIYKVIFVGSHEKAEEYRHNLFKMVTDAYPDANIMVNLEKNDGKEPFKPFIVYVD